MIPTMPKVVNLPQRSRGIPWIKFEGASESIPDETLVIIAVLNGPEKERLYRMAYWFRRYSLWLDAEEGHIVDEYHDEIVTHWAAIDDPKEG